MERKINDDPDKKKILIIDDELGAASSRRNRERENFCLTTGLRDITGDVEVEGSAFLIGRLEGANAGFYRDNRSNRRYWRVGNGSHHTAN